MEPKPKDPRHFVKRAGSIEDAVCLGRYMGVTIEKVVVNIPIQGESAIESKEKEFTLVRVLYSNLWEHRLTTETQGVKMIDTEGIQHSPESDLYTYEQETKVRIGKERCVPYSFESPDDTLEGGAKTRGWSWFSALPKGTWPHRLVFNFFVFEPGYTAGVGQDHETLEVVFDFNFKQLLPDARRFVTLELPSKNR